MKRLRYRVAFVTGGASGIGLAMARAFARHGMAVVIVDHDCEYLEEARGLACFRERETEFLLLDVTDREAMARAREHVRSHFGPVDLLCNNAGAVGQASIDDAEYGDWDKVLDVNLGSTVNGIVTFLPDMKAARRGHIVNTASMTALLPSPGGSGLYGTAKFAVRGLTESLRLSAAAHGIGVSLLCPGMVQTRILESSSRQCHRRSDLGATRTLDTSAMAPDEVADRVIAGVRSNAAYIVTHPGFRDEVSSYHADILEAMPEGAPASDRFQIERRARLIEARAQALALAN